jgi:curved DNA-binding protein CbpA
VPDEPDPYKVLQVDPEADPEVIQAAYRRLARKYHPDVMPGPEAAAKMVAINAAWAVVGEPEPRAEYDRERARRLAADRRRSRVPAARSPAGADTTAGSAAGSAPADTRPGATRRRGEAPPPPSDPTSPDWTPGRSTVGSTYDPRTMRAREGAGAAGPPPGNPSGSVLSFGRYAGWSLGEIARRDLEYLEWLDRVPIGRQHRAEIDEILRRAGRRRAAAPESTDRRGFFRRG